MTTIQINMHEAKSGKPYLDLIPHKSSSKQRKPGRYKGEIKISNDFDQTPGDINEAFEDNS